MSRLRLRVDTSKPDLGHAEYKAVVARKESSLISWCEMMKINTDSGTIARSLWTGVGPQALADGLGGLDMLKYLTFDTDCEGMLGLSSEDAYRGLCKIDHLSEQQRIDFEEQMVTQCSGYRFTATQEGPMLNPQYVLRFHEHVDRLGMAPESLDTDASTGMAKYLISNQKAPPSTPGIPLCRTWLWATISVSIPSMEKWCQRVNLCSQRALITTP
jgi:hypothetical protein